MTEEERHQPATRGDLHDLRQEISASIRQTEDRLVERMRDMQSELLRGFEKYARSNDLRFRRTEAEQSIDAERLANLEGRVTELERRFLGS